MKLDLSRVAEELRRPGAVTYVHGRQVFDSWGWHAECPACPGWRCHRQDHSTQEAAQRCATRHAQHKHGIT